MSSCIEYNIEYNTSSVMFSFILSYSVIAYYMILYQLILDHVMLSATTLCYVILCSVWGITITGYNMGPYILYGLYCGSLDMLLHLGNSDLGPLPNDVELHYVELHDILLYYHMYVVILHVYHIS